MKAVVPYRATSLGYAICPTHGVTMRPQEGRELRSGAPMLQWWACRDGCVTAAIPKHPARR